MQTLISNSYALINLKKVLYITFGWVLSGIALAIFEHIVSGASTYVRTSSYSFSNLLTFNVVVTFLAGIIVAGLEVFYIGEIFKKKPLWAMYVYKTGFYTLSIFILSAIGFFTVYQSSVSTSLLQFWTSNTFLKYFIVWSLISIVTLLILQVNNKYGHGMFFKQLGGKYHRPQEEERVFMFLDIKSSTSIAEKIGNVKYFELLQDFFHDITNPIIKYEGEIYQYVGDEIVVSWPVKKMKKLNPLKSFFNIRQTMNDLAPVYLDKYGVSPDFKAGFHFGKVTVGEVGVVKTEIVFSGDVLNTTSRLQKLCKQYDVELLLTREMVDKMSIDGEMEFIRLGEVILDGKTNPTEIFTVNDTSQKPISRESFL